MKLDPLLIATAVLYGAAGLALTFAPSEILVSLGEEHGSVGTWAAQLAGAGLLALAWSNWIQRRAVVAGIYGRPILLANLLFAATAGGASFSAWRDGVGGPALAATVVPGAVLVLFGLRLWRPAPVAHTPSPVPDGHQAP